jgi:hypothetical protein
MRHKLSKWPCAEAKFPAILVLKVILKHMAPQKLEKADILSNSAFYTGSNIKYSVLK